MWAWLWSLLELLPAAYLAGGVHMVGTGRVPRHPTYFWEWNYRTYQRASDIRALGWYHVTVGCGLAVIGGDVIPGEPTRGDTDR